MAEEEEFRLAEAGQKSPPEFSASYDKARKAYSLSSALLLAWALIGIDVDDKPIESLKVTFKSPQAVPYVLIALVIYFGSRFTVEWYQADEGRRARRPSRIDFALAHLIGTAGVVLYIVQTSLETQIADIIALYLPTVFLLPLMVGALTAQTIDNFKSLRIGNLRVRPKLRGKIQVAISWLVVLAMAWRFVPTGPPLKPYLILIGLGVAISTYATSRFLLLGFPTAVSKRGK